MSSQPVSQSQAEYLRARDALIRLRDVGSPEAGILCEALIYAMDDLETFDATVALTRQAEVLLGREGNG